MGTGEAFIFFIFGTCLCNYCMTEADGECLGTFNTTIFMIQSDSGFVVNKTG